MTRPGRGTSSQSPRPAGLVKFVRASRSRLARPNETERAFDLSPSAVQAGPRVGLATGLSVERSWARAPHAGTDRLDRFESAVAFAIQEAARLQHKPESRPAVVSQTEVSVR